MLKTEFAGTSVDATEENIQARCRGIILMAISNKEGENSVTTGNKSEMSSGLRNPLWGYGRRVPHR